MKQAYYRLLTWRPGGYARASAETFFWLILRAGLQVAGVVLLARLLGTADYGLFVAALAVASFFVPLAGMGLNGVVLRDGSREPALLRQLLGASLWLWARAAVLFSIAAAVTTWRALPNGNVAFWALLLLVLGEVIGASGLELLARAQQARQCMRTFGAAMVGLIAARLLALMTYALLARPDVQGWMAVYGVVSLGYLAVLFWLLRRDWRGSLRQQPQLWREGVPFAVGALSFRIQAEFNKPVLAHLSYVDAGVFSIAQRAVDMASLPLIAMQETLWPRAFVDADPHRRLRHALLAMLVFAVALGVLLVLAARWLPLLLGPGFEEAVSALQWLAWLPAIQMLRNVGNARLIIAGQSHRLSRVYIVGALAGAALSLMLIPRFGLFGAVLVAYGTEFVLIAVQRLGHKKPGAK